MAGPEVIPKIEAGHARPRLREPGLLGFQPGTERYRVPGGGGLFVNLDSGDRISVTDIEGRQPCELVAFDASGRADGGVLGARARAAACRCAKPGH